MTHSRKELNRWARTAGYNDFDTYVRAGNSVLDARRDIRARILELQTALNCVTGMNATSEPAGHANDDEPTDPDNAHAQGDDSVS